MGSKSAVLQPQNTADKGEIRPDSPIDDSLARLQVISVTKTSHSNTSAVELPAKLPEWLWSGVLPFTFLRSLVHGSLASASDLSSQQQPRDTIVNLTVQHPRVLCQLNQDHILYLMRVCLKFATEPGFAQNSHVAAHLAAADLNRWTAIQHSSRSVLSQLLGKAFGPMDKIGAGMRAGETLPSGRRGRDLLRGSMEQKLGRGGNTTFDADGDLLSGDEMGADFRDELGDAEIGGGLSREFINQAGVAGGAGGGAVGDAGDRSDAEDLSRTVEALALEGLGK